jgi:hypothetical protein
MAQRTSKAKQEKEYRKTEKREQNQNKNPASAQQFFKKV